jgi:hypothetical protein
MRAFFRSQLRLFALPQARDAVHYLAPARGLEFAVVARFPQILAHRMGSVSFVRVVADPKDCPFAVAHQTAGLDLFRLPLEIS